MVIYGVMLTFESLNEFRILIFWNIFVHYIIHRSLFIARVFKPFSLIMFKKRIFVRPWTKKNCRLNPSDPNFTQSIQIRHWTTQLNRELNLLKRPSWGSLQHLSVMRICIYTYAHFKHNICVLKRFFSDVVWNSMPQRCVYR